MIPLNHAHTDVSLGLPGWVSLIPLGLIIATILFTSGLIPVPVGYGRGKVKFIKWCGTGMHAHIVYWHEEDDGTLDSRGFQSIHPADCNTDR